MERSEGWRRTRDGGRAERASKNESRHSVRVHEAARRLALKNGARILANVGVLAHLRQLGAAAADVEAAADAAEPAAARPRQVPHIWHNASVRLDACVRRADVRLVSLL